MELKELKEQIGVILERYKEDCPIDDRKFSSLKLVI